MDIIVQYFEAALSEYASDKGVLAPRIRKGWENMLISTTVKTDDSPLYAAAPLFLHPNRPVRGNIEANWRAKWV